MSKGRFPISYSPRPNANRSIAHPYSAVGGGGQGAARRHSSIGIGGDTSDFIQQAPALLHAVPLFELFSEREKRLSSARKKPSKKPLTKKDIELSFIGFWPSQWENQHKSEAEMLDSVGANDDVANRKGRKKEGEEWSPSTNDFLRFGRTGHRKEKSRARNREGSKRTPL